MESFLTQIERLARANGHRIVVASRDRDAVPNLGPEFLIHWDSEALYFLKFPGSETIANLRRHPEVAVSLVDWVGRAGLQLKGLAAEAEAPTGPLQAPQLRDRLWAAGCRQWIRVAVQEIFDAAPGSGKRRAEWQAGRGWETGSELPPFRRPEIEPSRLDPTLATELDDFIQTILASRVPSFLGTVDGRGVPNVSPRFLLEAQPQFLLYGDAFKNKSFLNQSRPCPVAVAMVDWQTERGFQVRGWTDPQFRGEWILRVQQHWQRIGFAAQMVQAVLVRPEEVFKLELGPRRQLFAGHDRSDWLLAA